MDFLNLLAFELGGIPEVRVSVVDRWNNHLVSGTVIGGTTPRVIRIDDLTVFTCVFVVVEGGEIVLYGRPLSSGIVGLMFGDVLGRYELADPCNFDTKLLIDGVRKALGDV